MTLLRRYPQLAVVAIAAMLGGCNTGTICPLAVYPAIVVEVHDASTGNPAAADALGLVLRNDVVVDTLWPTPVQEPSNAIHLVSRRTGAGTFDVSVTRTGYHPWIREDVTVKALGGNCGGLQTVTLRADLVAISSPPAG